MKRIKFLMAFVFLLIGTLTVFALTNDKSVKSVVIRKCMKFIGPHPAHPTSFINPSNWEMTFLEGSQYCFNGWEICAICFNDLTTTPFEAMMILYDYESSTGHLPFHGQNIIDPFNGKMVTVYLKEIEEGE